MDAQTEAERLMQHCMAESTGDENYSKLYNAKELALKKAKEEMEKSKTMELAAYWNNVMISVNNFYEKQKGDLTL